MAHLSALDYDEHTRLAQALPVYFRDAGLPADGGHSSRWVPFEIAGIRLRFPNFDARRRVVRYHDVHHLLTGYPTTWTGEAQISAWEIASGCGRHWVAWMFNLPMLGTSLLFAPRIAFRAWCRGRRSRNFYSDAFEPLLRETLRSLRQRSGLDLISGPATTGERASFACWAGTGLALQLAPAVALLAAVF